MIKINGTEYFSQREGVEIPMTRVYALARLVDACAVEGAKIDSVSFFRNGFHVLFDEVEGSAVIHENSRGRDNGEWESFEMPWDHGEVSVHTPEKLARLVGLLQRGEY